MGKCALMGILLSLVLLVSSAGKYHTPAGDINESEAGGMGYYEFTFSVESDCGEAGYDTDFIFTYHGEETSSGQQLRFPLGVFSFQIIEICAIDRERQCSIGRAMLSIGVCGGGIGRTEMTVTGKKGTDSTYRIVCTVLLVGTEGTSISSFDLYDSGKDESREFATRPFP